MPTNQPERGSPFGRQRIYREDIRNTAFIELMLMMVFLFLIILAAAHVPLRPRPDFPADNAETLRTKLVRAELAGKMAEVEAERLRLDLDAIARTVGQGEQTPSRTLPDRVRILIQGQKSEIEALHKDLAQGTGQPSTPHHGRGLPSCWQSGDDQLEYLYTIAIAGNEFVATRAWPAHRQPEIDATPELAALDGRRLSLDEFSRLAAVIKTSGARQACRYYVTAHYSRETPSYLVDEIREKFNVARGTK